MRERKFTKEIVRKAVTAVAEDLHKKYSVRFILLFGSVSTGKTSPLSDVDLGVFLDPTAPRGLEVELAIGAILQKALDTDELDVVILNDVNPSLKFNAMKNGILLFCVDEGEYEDFCIRTASEFYDYSEFLERQFKTAKEYLRSRIQDE